mgnify:CR=1 FL=1
MDDAGWMREALAEADIAASLGEVPIGCVIVDENGDEIARGHNLRETEEDPTAHAEVVAVRGLGRGVGRIRGVDIDVRVATTGAPPQRGLLSCGARPERPHLEAV